MAAEIVLVLGGARSGKSRFAETLATDGAQSAHYIATAELFDQEMKERVVLHKQRRGEIWVNHEVPYELATALDELPNDGHPVLIDCLTLWLSNLMLADKDIGLATSDMTEVMMRSDRRFVLVANEVGLGIVPENRLARRFRDEAGIMNQTIAALAQKVYLVTAGLPLQLK